MIPTKKIFNPRDRDTGGHPDPDQFACFLDGKLEAGERRELLEHLNSCKDCYEIVQYSLGDLEAEKEHVKERIKPSSGRKVFALVASIALCVAVVFGIWFKNGALIQEPAVMTASIELDSELRQFLQEDQSLTWTGEKADRFAAMLARRGVEISGADTVLLASAYNPYVSKSLFKKKETLVISMKDGVVHVEIRQEE